jgi:Flp pilus assembly protein TadG
MTPRPRSRTRHCRDGGVFRGAIRGGAIRGGAIAAEFALTLPLLAFLLLATADFCRVFYYAQTLQACANDAVLFSSGTAKPPSGTTSTNAATSAALACGAGLFPPLQSTDVSIKSDAATSTVTVHYTFQPLISYPGMPGTIDLYRTATAALAPLSPGESR